MKKTITAAALALLLSSAAGAADSGSFTDDLKAGWNQLTTDAEPVAEDAKKAARKSWDAMKEWGSEQWEAGKEGAGRAADKAGEASRSLWDRTKEGVSQAYDAGKKKLSEYANDEKPEEAF